MSKKKRDWKEYNKKFHIQPIRWKEEEWNNVIKYSAEHGKTPTAYVKLSSLKQYKKIQDNKTINHKEVLFEINKIGTNLNQIAKKVNEESKHNSDLRLDNITLELEEVKKIVNDIFLNLLK